MKVVPILVGAVSAENEAMYGELLSKYVDDPNNFFSVSSDFCHWGSRFCLYSLSFYCVCRFFVKMPLMILCVHRFNYMHYDNNHGPIHKSIEALDKMGMDIIETGDPDAFNKYLLEFDNTICGRHPISIFLHVTTFFPMCVS